MNLDRQTVVRSALRLLDEHGLNGFTLRKLGSQLGVQAPALYWHFKNKQELFDEMATTVIAEGIRESGLAANDTDWPEWAMELGRVIRQILLSHRDGARMFSGRYLNKRDLFEVMEIALRKLTSEGFTLRDAARGLNTIYCYAVGFAIEEQAVFPRAGKRSKRYDLTKRAKRIDATKFPLSVAVGEHVFEDFDEQFEHGLRLIIEGLRP